jgi:tetratricopeptide (TPR) repeat protein
MSAIEEPTTDNYGAKGLRELMNGDYHSAIQYYEKALQQPSAQVETKLELACTLAANKEYNTARAILEEFQASELSLAAKSRYQTTVALIKSGEELTDEIPSILAEAISLDPSFPLPYFSLGRYYQVVEKDVSRAIAYLQQASDLANRSYGPIIHLLSTELGEDHFSSAKASSTKLITEFPFAIRTFLAFITTQLIATPFRGRLFLLLASLSLFIPYWGPALLLIWSIITVASFLTLRKLGSYLVAFSLVSELWLVLAYFVRALILGVFP